MAVAALTDQELVTAVRARDPRAFEALDARYRRPLQRYAERVLGSRRSLAEDAVQEALWRAHRSLLSHERPVVLRPWLYRIVRNACLDELRRPASSWDELEDAGATVALEDTVVDRERARQALAGVAALPSRQREALVSGALAGEPQALLAARLGISGPAARSLVHRARVTLSASNDTLAA